MARPEWGAFGTLTRGGQRTRDAILFLGTPNGEKVRPHWIRLFAAGGARRPAMLHPARE
jgi:hypothetical protein